MVSNYKYVHRQNKLSLAEIYMDTTGLRLQDVSSSFSHAKNANIGQIITQRPWHIVTMIKS